MVSFLLPGSACKSWSVTLDSADSHGDIVSAGMPHSNKHLCDRLIRIRLDRTVEVLFPAKQREIPAFQMAWCREPESPENTSYPVTSKGKPFSHRGDSSLFKLLQDRLFFRKNHHDQGVVLSEPIALYVSW